jgi:hypothetical protein
VSRFNEKANRVRAREEDRVLSGRREAYQFYPLHSRHGGADDNVWCAVSSLLTRRWREMDSNFRFRAKGATDLSFSLLFMSLKPSAF